MVVSGINAGANLGDDTLYSGTVAAAVEGRHLGYSAIAISNISATPRHYASAAHITLKLIDHLSRNPLPGNIILNVNVPDLPYDRLQGCEVTRLGNRHRAERAKPGRDANGELVWRIGMAGAGQDCGPGTDFYAVENHRVSITPLVVDLTRYSALDTLRNWVRQL